MSVQFLKRKPLWLLYGVGVVLLLGAGWIWWNRVNTNPERVFWGTLTQSLRSSSVTVQASQSGNGTTMHQTVQYALGGQNFTHSLTTLTQGTTTVQDEMLGTPAADYTRYAHIKTDQKSASGKPLNFTSIVGVWAKTDNASNRSQLMSQAILGSGMPLGGVAFPVANLQPSQRAALIKQIKDDGVYKISFNQVGKSRQNGRLYYTYHVLVKPGVYANMMKMFARDVGLHDLDQLDPQQFASSQDFGMDFTVDVYARQLVTAQASSGAVRQTYSSYDVPAVISLPKNTITSQELQKRLQQIQQ